MSNIEKIRQEIERRKKVYLTKNGFPTGTFGAIKIETYEGLLAFIDSLPEEKPSYVTDSPGDPGNPGEPGISDLEEAAEEYAGVNYDCETETDAFYHHIQKEAFIAGAEWQKRQVK